jgi:hypothetical protein
MQLLTPPGGPPPDSLVVAALKGTTKKLCLNLSRRAKQAMSNVFARDNLEAEVATFFDGEATPERTWYLLRVCYELKRLEVRSWLVAEENINKKAQMPPAFAYFSDVLSFTGFNGNVLVFMRDLGAVATREQASSLCQQLQPQPQNQ